MLETTGEIRVASQNSDPIIPNPRNIKLLTAPLTFGRDPKFFDLTANDDVVELTTGILNNTSGGLRGLGGDDFIKGSAAAEMMNGNADQDTLIGGCGKDTLRGGQDFDILYGECDDDLLSGNQGDDYAYGGTGNDFIRGGQGRDALVGDSGNDILIGDVGIDKLWGGEGADLFVVRRETGALSREFGSNIPRPVSNVNFDQVPADFILDYNLAQGDVIGLAGDLKPSDVVLTERFVSIGDARDYDSSGPFPLGAARTADFRVLNTKVTVIRETSTNNILGLVKDVSPNQLRLIPVSETSIALG